MFGSRDSSFVNEAARTAFNAATNMAGGFNPAGDSRQQPVVVTCPHCQQQVNIPPASTNVFACGHCGGHMNVQQPAAQPAPQPASSPQSAGQQGPAPAPASHDIRCSLEDIHSGVTKRLRIHRIEAGAAAGERTPHTIEATVQPGMKEGTKMTFKGHGDHLPGRAPQDVVLTLREKPHERFKRSGSDLLVELSLDPAQSGSTTIRGVDGATVTVPIPELVRHKSQVSVAGVGLPERRNGALTGSRGALRVTFNLETRCERPAVPRRVQACASHSLRSACALTCVSSTGCLARCYRGDGRSGSRGHGA